LVTLVEVKLTRAPLYFVWHRAHTWSIRS